MMGYFYMAMVVDEVVHTDNTESTEEADGPAAESHLIIHHARAQSDLHTSLMRRS